jgi:hypothetical protein
MLRNIVSSKKGTGPAQRIRNQGEKLYSFERVFFSALSFMALTVCNFTQLFTQ